MDTTSAWWAKLNAHSGVFGPRRGNDQMRPDGAPGPRVETSSEWQLLQLASRELRPTSLAAHLARATGPSPESTKATEKPQTYAARRRLVLANPRLVLTRDAYSRDNLSSTNRSLEVHEESLFTNGFYAEPVS